MKKSNIWAIVIVVIILIGGGALLATQHSSQQTSNASYTKAMDAGKQSVKDKQYMEASDHFGHAYDINPTNEAKVYRQQASAMNTATDEANSYAFGKAISAAQSAAKQSDGYSVLKHQAKSLLATLYEVMDNYQHEIKPLLNQAKLNEGNQNYTSALDYYHQVLSLPYIKEKYYGKYHKQAKAGAKRVQKALNGQVDPYNKEKENQTSSANAQSSSSSKADEDSKSQSDTGTAGQKGAGKMGDHTVAGKTVDDDQLSSIKKKLDSLGYNSASWSPQDMIDLFRSANENGHSSPDQITKDDVENYLK